MTATACASASLNRLTKGFAVRVLLTSLSVALLPTACGLAAEELTYVEGAPAQRVTLADPVHRASYFARLSPELDTRNRVVVLDLELCTAHGKRDCSLLEPEGNWHGAEPFFFVASEFAPGSRNIIFGRIRTIHIRHTHARLYVSIDKATIKTNDAFGVLSLELALMPAGPD